MGDRVAVLNGGVLQQVDKPSVLYRQPANMFVAGFVGSPAMNLFESTISIGDAGVTVATGDQQVELPLSFVDDCPALRGYDGLPLVCGIRPDDVYDAALAPDFSQRVTANVQLLEELGSEIVAHLDIGVQRVDSGGPSDDADDDEDLGSAFLGRFAQQSEARVGQRMEIAIDVSALHFFDRASGEVIRA